jgi:hypothetical protein
VCTSFSRLHNTFISENGAKVGNTRESFITRHGVGVHGSGKNHRWVFLVERITLKIPNLNVGFAETAPPT